MPRRVTHIVVLSFLIAFAALDAYLLISALIHDSPLNRMSQVAPQSGLFDQLAITTTGLSWYVFTTLSVAALLTILPRPERWKLIAVTVLLLTLMVAQLAAGFHLLRRGTIHLADGGIIVYGGGILGWSTLLEFLWHAKTTILAWTLWRLHRRANRTAGQCPNCSYSLAGAPSDRCPECGTPIRTAWRAASIQSNTASVETNAQSSRE